ncbi:DNA replication protein [Aspergillus terreus]|uniref:DNA replication protein n=1 Tax=Aspergillus terreus TaxID=33178 RepID=A0A5M3YPN8_ASPTE|nr:hypothetical protein ATETN484_0002055300 [Aspergillus terreus]GFF15409.1 DNA replication protein [Aspergillus terreus]
MTSMVETSWPPKSPREALLCSPSGRKKYQDMQRQRENLGSPLKLSHTSPNLRAKANDLLSDGVDELGDDTDEDEETLELKLAAIQARLKLKQLQRNRAKSNVSESDPHGVGDAHSRPASAVGLSSRSQDPSSRMKSARREAGGRLPADDDVQVPLSPTRRPAAPPLEPVSPRRYLMGIDKGLKGSDVSLKRPPSSRIGSRPTSRLGSRDGLAGQSRSFEEPKRVKSFSERMAESRAVEKVQRERAERVQINRSSGFQYDKAEMESFKAAAAEARAKSPLKSPTKARQAESFSRDDVLRSYNLKPALKRSQTAPTVRKHGADEQSSEPRSYLHRRNHKSESGTVAGLPSSSQDTATEGKEDEALEKAPDASKFEAFSSLHLSNRILPHSFLTRTLADKKVLRIPDLLRTVKGPSFELPEDIDGDYVVFGIVASKSEPKQIKETKHISAKETNGYDDGLNNTDKYMAITLTDLKWTIDLFLFDTAFPRYYRISEGILVAILNPTILPPPKHKTDTNRFSLSLNSSDDTILEVGYAQDIGFCKAVRKDGKTCQSWVDARKTEFCDFHVDIQVRRTQAQRPGVNNGTGMYAPGGRSGSRTGFFGGGGKRSGGYKTGLRPAGGAQWDQGSQSTFYIAPAVNSRGTPFHHMPTGQSAASLLDADNDDPFIAAGMMARGSESKEERARRRLAEQKREREITQKLTSSRGGGVGADYLRARSAENMTPRVDRSKAGSSETANTPSHSLLMGFRKADTVKLTPMKRVHDGDKPHGSGVKKTRFITAKGIKEAGRDSLGGRSDAVASTNYDDDDDELDII